MEVATIHGKMACGLPLLILPEHVHVRPWSADVAVRISAPSDHAYQSVPFGATETFGKFCATFAPGS